MPSAADPNGPPPYQVPPPMYAAPPPPQWGTPPAGGPPQPYVPPVPYTPGHYPAPWTTNGLSIAGLILSILWLGGLGSVLGVIFGHVSQSQIKKQPQRGAGLSLAALIVGYAGIIGSIVFYANVSKILNSGFVQDVVVQEDIKDAANAERDYRSANLTFTNNPVDLRNHGFDPSTLSHNTILAAYNRDVGFCLVGAHDDSNTWYLYDSNNNSLNGITYSTKADAEFACSVEGVGDYTQVA